jgi:hypothetical protein
MSSWDEKSIIKTYSKFLGVDESEFNGDYMNPLNKEILTELEHNDIWGI